MLARAQTRAGLSSSKTALTAAAAARNSACQAARASTPCARASISSMATTSAIVPTAHANGARSIGFDVRRAQSLCNAAATRAYATVASDSNSNRTTTVPPPSPDMASSLDSIVPETLFSDATESAKHGLPRDVARRVVEIVLTQLREGVDVKTVEEAKALQTKADEEGRALMQQHNLSAESLSKFALALLSGSRDPRRTPVSYRLSAIAFGVDPESLADPTAKSASSPQGLDESLASVPIAGEGKWGVNAAGYNWASMILSGQAPPPAGLHTLERGKPEALEAIKDQQAAAVRIYATLAMRGDPQGMLGMGRILLAGTQRHAANATGDSKQAQENQTKLMRDRALALWTKAGQKGVGEAWFELGLLKLSPGGSAEDAAQARGYFEKGAKAGDARSNHALGVLLTQDAMKDNRTPPPPERTQALTAAFEHFKAAADMGDGQSAHHLGLRYLLRDEMVQEVGLGSDTDGRTPEQVQEAAASRHKSLWNVKPDDKEALRWFEKAAEGGFVPSMLNVAGFLVEGRGTGLPPLSDTVTADVLTKRMVDLKRAESLYAKVAAHTSAVMQQTGGDEAAKGDAELGANQQMAAFAQQALGKVQEAIQQTAELTKNLGSQKPQDQ